MPGNKVHVCYHLCIRHTTKSAFVHFRPVITRWSGSTCRMRVISESRYTNLPSRTRLVAVSVVFGGWGIAPIRRVYWLNRANWPFFAESFYNGINKSETLRVPTF